MTLASPVTDNQSCTMHDTERTANLLGAAGLALTDLTLGAATTTGRVSPSSAAALLSLLAVPGLSVSELGRRVRLTQPAAARMVDALETDGIVEKIPSTENRRQMTVRLTPDGQQLARQMLGDRNALLREIVASLDDREQRALAGVLEKILTQLHDTMGHGQRICRLCDRVSCTRSAPCPIGRAERAARG